jgi:hypothetical protein
MQGTNAMPTDERSALLALIRQRIEAANKLMLIAQGLRFPGCQHPPMLFHWDDDWDDMPASDLLDVCAWLNEIVGRLEKSSAAQS